MTAAESVLAGDRLALSRLLTQVETAPNLERQRSIRSSNTPVMPTWWG